MTDKIKLTTWTGQNIDAVVRFTSLIIKDKHSHSLIDNPLNKRKNIYCWTIQNDFVLINKSMNMWNEKWNYGCLFGTRRITMWTGRMTTETSLLITWRDGKPCFWCIETEETFSKAIIEEAWCYTME